MKHKRLILFIAVVLFVYPATAISAEWTVQESFWDGTHLLSVCGSSSSDIFAVGHYVTIGHTPYCISYLYNGTTWNFIGPEIGMTTRFLYGVWGSSGRDIFAVGYGGKILHYDGSAWSAMTSETTSSLRGVWGSSGSDVFAVGDAGKILHYNGSTWAPMTSGTTNTLYGVWGSSGTDVFAVGASGVILHYNGVTWSPMTSGATQWLHGVWGSSGTDVFAVGSGGIILHYNGSTWSSMSSGMTLPYRDLNGVWGSSGSDVFAVGYESDDYPGIVYNNIWHYDGSAWSAMESGIEAVLYGVWGSSGTDVFAVGTDVTEDWDIGNGIVLHYGETVTTTTVPPTTTVSTTTTVQPTLVRLIDFNAVPGNRIITLAWSTASEIDNAGFNLYRSTSENGEYEKLNDSLIPAQGSSTQGASYKFIDKDVKNRQTYFYKLEDIDINGVSTFHGPVAATPRLIYGLRD